MLYSGRLSIDSIGCNTISLSIGILMQIDCFCHTCSERYRDLIDAADSIVDMKKCSELVS